MNIIGASIGFIAAIFFAVGAATMSPKDVYNTVVMRRDINQHWYESVSNQRAEYIVGSTLLFLAYIFQLASNFIPTEWSPYLLQSFACAVSLCCAAVTLLLIVALLARHAIAKSCGKQVRELWEQEIAASQQRTHASS